MWDTHNKSLLWPGNVIESSWKGWPRAVHLKTKTISIGYSVRVVKRNDKKKVEKSKDYLQNCK